MTSEKKMIIITSDQNLIEQFQLNPSQHTQILTFEKQTEENNDFMNLTFAQLFQPNSKNDQIYKRALDLPQDHQSKQMKTSKNANELICTICNARAIGYNYDVLSCASCKSFFRRNAFQDLTKLRCLRDTDQCSVAHDVRRKCTKCRLNRCFLMGMKKSFLLNDEERSRRKHRSSSTKNSKQSDEIEIDFETIDEKLLSDDDWIFLDKLESLFVSIFQNEAIEESQHVDIATRTTVLLHWSQFVNQVFLRSINFFRQIEQFEQLNSSDRFILIKHNLFSIYPLSKCYYFNKTNSTSSLTNQFDDEIEGHRKFFQLCQAPLKYEKFINLIVSLVQITEQNPILLALLFLILLFTPGLSLNENEPPLNDSLSVHRTQIYFTKFLWNYLIFKWGDLQGQMKFLQLHRSILHIQSGTQTYRNFLRDQYKSLDDVDQIGPLMQSVLHIS